MRIGIATFFLIASASIAMAQPVAPGAGPGSAGPLQTYDVVMNGKPQTVYILKRILKPGESIGLHYHLGVEITQVISGDFQLTVNGRSHVYHAGDGFLVPRQAHHDGKNIGSTDAQLAVTYVLDKGAPLRVSVPAK